MDGCKQENKMTTGYEKEDVMKRERKRIAAWIMAFIMVWSLVMVPGGQAQAAETTKQLTYTAGSVTETGNTSNQVSLNLGNGGYSSIADLKSAGVTKLRITFEVTSATASESSTVGAQAFINAKDLWEGQWANVSAGSGEQTVELDLTQYYTSSAQLYNFGFQFENVSSITYQIKNAELVLGGTSGGSSGGGESSDFGTSRDYSSEVTATLTNQKVPTGDWSSFDMTLNNNSGSSICDWIVVLQVPSGTASKFKCWNATFVANGDTIYMYPMQTGKNAVLSTGTMQNDIPGGGFSGKCVDASSIQVKEVYYNKGTSSSYDYSNGDTNDETGGNGGSGGSGSGSAPDSSTNKDLDVEYNYAKVLQESLYFYDANMCGNLEGKCALNWRGNCHTKKDSSVTYTNNGKTYTLDVSGGFHDAGDHVKFGLPQGYAASMLGMSYYQFKDAFEELGQTEHLKTITDYFCDYFKRCTVYEGNDVIAFCYQVGDGGSDHAIWSAPENQDGLERPAFFADASNPATDEVSVAIAALALNYKNFGNAEDLKVAKDLYAFVQKNSKACATKGAGGYYDSTSYGDDLALAASALMVATGDSSYNAVYNEYKESGNNGVNQYWVLDWANSGAMACMLQKDSAKLKSITEVCTQKGKIDGVFNCVSDWGSCRYSAAEQFTGLVYDKLTGTSTFKNWAISQMNYMIGDNPNKRCYIVGYNENSSKYPHHRAASNSTGDKVYNKNHYTLLGAVVGGPGSGGQYYDKQEDYHCNEVALDYNAGLVGAAAGLYLVSKNSDTTYLSYAKKDAALSKELASAEEISAVGVTKYYGTSSTTTKATAITVTPTTLSLTEGETEKLSATVTPAKANQKVTWTSSDKTVATVDATGKVTANAAGDAKIIATTKDGTALTATCAVTVTAAPKAELVAKSTSISCDELEYGYTTGSSASVVITNKGNADANTTIAMENGSVSAFTLTGAVSAIAAGEEATLTVQAKTGLAAGAYTDNIKVTYGKNELNIPVEVNVAKADCTQTAENPVLVKRTSNSITVNTADGVEYSLNGKDWIQKKADESTVTFTGLSAFTKYSVVARYAETATHKAGAVSDKTDVYTLVEDPYVIDVSKATDANYMDALQDEDGTTTATLADNVLTLDKKDKTYTICGNNEDITVKAENIVKIIFKDAKIKDLVIANTDGTVNTDIQIDKASDGTATDDVVIKGGIKADKGSVTITGDGKLSSGRIEATGSVTIKDANISVSGEKDVPAIKGDKVTIKDSTVKADVPKDSSKETKPIESGNITLIGNNDISSTDGDKDIYSSVPKDENGQELIQYEVKYLDSDGNEVKASEKVYKGTEVTLPKVPAKKGYAGKWKDASGKVYEVGTKQVVTGDVTYTTAYEKIPVTKITLDSTSETLTVGDDTILIATVTPDDAFDTSVQWSTNNAKVATVTDGTVTAVAAGTAEITATAKDGSGVKATCRITVLAKATQDSDQKGDKDPKQNDSDEDMDNDEPIDVAKIAITGITRKVAPGKRITLKANVFPANADNQDVTWSIRSEDKKYATVNSKGVVSVKKSAKGRKIVVMATSDEDDSIQAVYKITVMKQAVKKVKLIAKTKKIKVKKSTTIKAVLSPSKGISKEVSWTSSNPKIATVNAKGKVTGIKKGKVKITATAKDGSGRKAKITIQVK